MTERTVFTTSSRSAAHREAAQHRAEGRQVRVVRRSGVYTQPGRGVTSFVNFDVRVQS